MYACLVFFPAAAEKEAALRAFTTGRTPVLISTTVVEVGVDVPAASLILVEHADRFGLAQLHQLRGRVGRGTRPSSCYLVADNKDSMERLRVSCACVAWLLGAVLAVIVRGASVWVVPRLALVMNFTNVSGCSGFRGAKVSPKAPLQYMNLPWMLVKVGMSEAC
mgnify:CR=1 FL=1